MPNYTPWSRTVTLPNASQNYQLQTLVTALDASLNRQGPTRCTFLQLQLDKDAGGANLFIGNQNMTSTDYGTSLVATQAKSWPPMESNLLRLDHIYLRTDTPGVLVHVDMVTR